MRSMTPLERVQKALDKQEPDRIPSFEWEIDEKVMAELLPGAKLLDFVEWADLDGVAVFADTRKKYLDSVTYLDVAYFVRKGQGVDISLAFKELPPE